MSEKTNMNAVVRYEAEADVLSWTLTDDPIDYAEEAGNRIVPFSKKHVPVYVELLNAKSFLTKSTRMTRPKRRHVAARRVVA